MVALGELEDRWDRLLEKSCGLKRADGRAISWATESSKAENELLATVRRHAQREDDMTRKLIKVREKERILAEQEKKARIEEKRRRREARRATRMGDADFTDIRAAPETAVMAG